MADPNLVRGGWRKFAPRDELAPVLSLEDDGGCIRLCCSASGDENMFGGWIGTADLRPGRWYKAEIPVTYRGVTNPELFLYAEAGQHFLRFQRSGKNSGIFSGTFFHQKKEDGTDVGLFFRFSKQGSVVFHHPSITEISRPAHRKPKIAVTRFDHEVQTLTMEEQRRRIGRILDDAGHCRPDAVLLPEAAPFVGVPYESWDFYRDGEKVPEGPVCRILAEKAARYRMYVIAGLMEVRDGYLYNTAVIFDRDGNFFGQYDKTHPTIGGLKRGESPGKSYPVFDFDFGRGAVHICYDEWFPEVSRLYALKGAEILFLCVMGGKPITWRTRALDNGIYFAASSINPPSMIIDSSGEIAAQISGDGVAAAECNLDYRKVNVYGDPTLSYGMPLWHPERRNVTDNRLLSELNILSNPNELT
ncbi:MAG: carbon-nitrogen hydrolase family protein [Spirochaetia bacterium]